MSTTVTAPPAMNDAAVAPSRFQVALAVHVNTPDATDVIRRVVAATVRPSRDAPPRRRKR